VGAELGRHRQVVFEIVALAFQEVVDLGEPRHGEDVVWPVWHVH